MTIFFTPAVPLAYDPTATDRRAFSRPVPLTQANLTSLSPAVTVPEYGRAALTPSVVHIGVGGFHRAHQAVYFDDVVRNGISTDWGLVGVGLHSDRMGEVLSNQDNLYTVVVRDHFHDEVRVVGVIVDYHFAPEDPAGVLDRLASETTRLVTLTITGSGYPAGGEVDPDDPDVLVDVNQPGSPATVFGYLVEALDRRRRGGLRPFTVLSCDNVQGNGAVTRAAVVSTARLRNRELASWIEENVAFPSSMVDRITPETTPGLVELLARRYGVEDQWPVTAEPFTQWIVEDTFCNGRPPLDQVGVQFVPQVLPYEVMKARLLNGAHCALGYLGWLAGFRTTDRAMADPRLREFIAGYLREASALLPPVPGVNLGEYCETLLDRFSNPRVGDQLSRLCRRGSTKVPSYVLPSLLDAYDQGRPYRHLVLAVAAWLRYLHGVDYAGEPIAVEDVRADELRLLAERGTNEPDAALSEHDVFRALAERPGLTAELTQSRRLLEQGPLEAAVALTSGQVAATRVPA